MNISDLLTQEEKDFLIDFYRTYKVRWFRIGDVARMQFSPDSNVDFVNKIFVMEKAQSLFQRLGLNDAYGYLYCHFIEKDDEVGFYFRIEDLREKKNTI